MNMFETNTNTNTRKFNPMSIQEYIGDSKTFQEFTGHYRTRGQVLFRNMFDYWSIKNFTELYRPIQDYTGQLLDPPTLFLLEIDRWTD